MKVTALAPWFGSKRTLAPLIVEQLGKHKAYVEPFCGSCAVLLAKPPCSFEIVNDLHGDLTNLGWTIQHPKWGPALYRRMRRTLFTENTFHDAKASIEKCFCALSPHDLDAASGPSHFERACLYFILCWLGRSGMLGTKGANNSFALRYTANGGNQAGRFVAAVDSIPAWRRRLRSTTIVRRNGFDLLGKLADDEGLAIYCDPPYLEKGAAYEHDFLEHQHWQLAMMLGRFEKARIVVSYYDHPKLADLYGKYWTKIDCARAKHLSVQGRRGGAAKTAPEVLLVNDATGKKRE